MPIEAQKLFDKMCTPKHINNLSDLFNPPPSTSSAHLKITGKRLPMNAEQIFLRHIDNYNYETMKTHRSMENVRQMPNPNL